MTAQGNLFQVAAKPKSAQQHGRLNSMWQAISNPVSALTSITSCVVYEYYQAATVRLLSRRVDRSLFDSANLGEGDAAENTIGSDTFLAMLLSQAANKERKKEDEINPRKTSGLLRLYLQEQPTPRFSFVSPANQSISLKAGLSTEHWALLLSNLSHMLANCHVRLDGQDEIFNYIKNHFVFGKLVVRICEAMRSHFGGEVELVLTYYRDPEIDDPHLTLLVRQAPYPPDLLDQIDAVRAPFDHELDQSTGMLVVTTDYCSPRGSHGV